MVLSSAGRCWLVSGENTLWIMPMRVGMRPVVVTNTIGQRAVIVRGRNGPAANARHMGARASKAIG